MLPKRLKEIRKERGIRQEEISQYLGVKRQTYSAYERGVSVPDSLTLKKLADYFEVSVEAFFHDPESDDSLVLQEQQLLLLARKANKIPKSQRERLIKNFEENIELYLEAMNLSDQEDNA